LNRQFLSYISSILIVIFITFTAYKTYQFSLKYDDEIYKNAQNNKIENKIDNYIDKLIPIFKNEVDKKPTTYKVDMDFYKLLFFIGVGLIFMTYFISTKEVFTISIITVALVSWFVGVFAPIMSIEIFKELPIFGYTIFKYDTKSIYSTIEKLWILQNYLVSVMVAVFSMIIPLVKTIALYISTTMKVDIKYIDFIGKWSMADVFVISLLLANLSLSSDEFTDAKVQVGIYFFSCYVVLSIFASYILNLDRE